jgi:hypothetical protein
VEQIVRQVFPKLGVRVVKSSMTCIPGQLTRMKPRLAVEALVKTSVDAGNVPAAVPPTAESDEPVSSDAVSPLP